MPRITRHGGPSYTDGTPDQPKPAESHVEAPADSRRSEYTSWGYKALQDESKRRGLPRTGTAAELAGRLQRDDEGGEG